MGRDSTNGTKASESEASARRPAPASNGADVRLEIATSGGGGDDDEEQAREGSLAGAVGPTDLQIAHLKGADETNATDVDLNRNEEFESENSKNTRPTTSGQNGAEVTTIKWKPEDAGDKHGQAPPDGKGGKRAETGQRKSSATASRNDKAGEFKVVKVGVMRHVVAILALSGILVANMNRQAYNQALVRMIRLPPATTTTTTPLVTTFEPPTTPLTTPTSLTADVLVDGRDAPAATELVAAEPIEGMAEEAEGFDWNGSQISLLQAAFSYGYTFFMIPGGRMSEIYGAKWVIFLSSFGSALCSLMTPLLANSSFTLLVASRVFMGLCQTGISPALYALYSRWLPHDEASFYLPLIKVGVMLGFMTGSLVNGFLPWQTMFYVLGLFGLAWSALWAFFASSLPSEHKFISQVELKYIRHCQELRVKTQKPSSSSSSASSPSSSDDKTAAKNKTKSAPWLRIIKNPIVLAFTFTKFTIKLSTDTQTMQIPMFMRNVFQISDQLNGVLNGANFAIQAIFTGVVAYVAKRMVAREPFGLHKTGIRRLFQGINCFGMALAYLLISINMGSLNLVCWAVILLSVTSMFGAGGEAVLPIDLTTEYSASIMAIANSVANFSGIVLPPIVSFFLAGELTSSENWNHVWWLISAIMACGGLMFTCLVKAKIQGFNEGKKVKRPKGAEESSFATTMTTTTRTSTDTKTMTTMMTSTNGAKGPSPPWTATELAVPSKTSQV